MSMPGFRAEAPLCNAADDYHMATVWGNGPAASYVPSQSAPQIPPDGSIWGPCVEVGPGVWRHENLNTGDLQPCSPTIVCGSCLPDPSSRTGCSEDCSYRGASYTRHFSSRCPCPPGGGGTPWGGGVSGIDQCAPCMLGGLQICERSDGTGLYPHPCQPRPGDPVAVSCQPANHFKLWAFPPGCYCGISCTYTTGGNGFYLEHWCGPYCF